MSAVAIRPVTPDQHDAVMHYFDMVAYADNPNCGCLREPGALRMSASVFTSAARGTSRNSSLGRVPWRMLWMLGIHSV